MSRKPNFLIRRIIALAVVVLFVSLIIAGVSAAVTWVTGIFAPAPSATPVASASATPGSDCDPAKIVIEARVTNSAGSPQSTFDSGINPFFSFKATNQSEIDCVFDVGPAVVYYSVTSGEQVIWESADCDRTKLVGYPVLIKAGESVSSSTENADWYRVFSSAKGCGADQQPVIAGGASYHLVATVNGVKSDNVQFILN